MLTLARARNIYHAGRLKAGGYASFLLSVRFALPDFTNSTIVKVYFGEQIRGVWVALPGISEKLS